MSDVDENENENENESARDDWLLRGVASAPPRQPPSPFRGSVRFDLLRRIGEGSFGLVYEALDRETHSRVALKVLRQLTAESLFRFKAEFRALADVSHPNVIRLDRLHQEGDHWFFTMELLEGVDFLTWTRAAPSHLLPAFEQLARGVAKLHSVGITHRDLKPSNVLVDAEGRVILLDFGLAGSSAREDPSVSFAGGTPLYMAPEQVTDQAVSPAADWYSVGVILYEVLTGHPPFDGSTREVLAEKKRRLPPAPADLPAGVPASLGRLCMDMLRIVPDERPGSRDIQDRLALMRGEAVASAVEDEVSVERFFGRDVELARLHALWAELDGGRPLVALISGSSGIGKSALAVEFCDRLRATEPDLFYVQGRCFEQEAVPFKALDSVVDAIARQLARMKERDVHAVLPDDPSAMARLFPVLSRVGSVSERSNRGPTTDGVEARRHAFDALRQLLVRLGLRRKVLVLIDDLQWGDADSATLLSELLHQPDGPRLMLIATYRADERTESACVSQLLPRLRRQSLEEDRLGLAELSLDGLDAATAREAALAALDKPDPAQAEIIAQESGGFPFLIRELARFASRSVISSAGPVESQSTSILEQSIVARVAALPEAARRILEIMAVAARPISRRTALAAAGDDTGHVAALALLRAERLSRARHPSRRDQIEPYHDRIREIVLETISPARRREMHLGLANSFEIEGADAGVLAWHYHEGGRDEIASRQAALAGDQAQFALAFEMAAQHYQMALEWFSGDGERSAQLTRRRAEALASAGRGAQAGPLFLALAARAPVEHAFELRRSGVDQLLVSGLIDEGLVELKRLAADVGLRFPKNQTGALVTMMWSLISLWLRGALSGRLRGAAASSIDLHRADVAASGFRGLLGVEPAHAGYFAVAELYFARRTDERKRISMSLARVGAGVLGPGPPAFARMGGRLIDAAEQIAKGVEDPHLHGFLSIARGAQAFWAGRWDQTVSFAEEGLEILRRGAGNAGHEWNLAQVVVCRSLEELGRWSEARRRSELLLSDAIARGDRYATVSAQLALGMEMLTAGDIPAARRWADEAVSDWQRHALSVQEVYALRIRLFADLASGQGAAAWAVLHEAWPRIRAGMHLAIRASLIDLLVLRGALALAQADTVGEREPFLSVATKAARALARAGRIDALGHASALEAGVAQRRGFSAQARSLWLTAENQYSAAGMTAAMLGARLVRDEFAGDSTEVSIATLYSFGVSDPKHWVTWYLPSACPRA